MLGNRPRPMISKLSELLISGARAAALMDTSAGSPRGPLDMSFKTQSSPRGLKSYDLGGIGLGIVVALNKSGEAGGREILPKSAVCSPGLTRSEPIPVQSIKNSDGLPGGVNEMELGSLEDYTYVTCHLPNKTFTKVYYDGGEAENLRIAYNENIKPINICNPRRTNPESLCETEQTYPTSDFLSSCHLCRKKLHGRDIYMYRGEKAFCSPECRSSQIMMDERKEQCRSEASRSVEVSSSPYNRDQIFSTGILAL